MTKRKLPSTIHQPPITKKLDELLANTGDMALKRRARRIIEELDPKDGDKILDVGCGDGFYLHLLSNIGLKLKLTGTDFDERALESARRNLRGKDIKLIWGDLMRELPFKDNSFDKIIMSEVTEHLPDDFKGLKEIHRVLKPGGTVFITVPHANYPLLWDPVSWFLEHLFDTHIKSGFFAGVWNQHERLYDKEQIKKVVERAGLKVKNVESLTWWCLPFNHYLINLGARILVSGKNLRIVTEGANKFKETNKKSLLPRVYFYLAEKIDRLNDISPQKTGVSLLVVARK